MSIDEIFNQYKKDRRRYRRLEWSLAGFLESNERILRESEKRTIALRIASVRTILESLTNDEQIVLHYRYLYGRGDWEWQAMTHMYVSRDTMYRRLKKRKQRFLEAYEKGRE
jgi:hypothetical protein